MDRIAFKGHWNEWVDKVKHAGAELADNEMVEKFQKKFEKKRKQAVKWFRSLGK